jgi:hypothetical protein
MGRCPKCGISNPESAVRCDCGHILKNEAPSEFSRESDNQASPDTRRILATEYRGQNGTILLQENALVIKRGAKGFLLGGGMLRGDKTIPYSSIVAVQFKKVGALQGYIQFTLKGGPEAQRGWKEAWEDENSVTFNYWGDNIRKFSELKRFVEGKMGLGASPAPSTIIVSTSPAAGSSSSLDELEKLARLREKGIVTEEEFQLKKKQLLGL